MSSRQELAKHEQPINPNVQKLGIGLSWDRGGCSVDVDLQAVLVDRKGSIVDAVYYNNLKALGCVTHSGDEQTGDRAGIDECIWATLKKVPQTIVMMIFIVAAYGHGHLRDAANGTVHILEDNKKNEVLRYPLQKSNKEVDIVLNLIRNSNGEWIYRILDGPGQEGRHFMDILEPCLGNLIREVIPSAPKRQKVAFAMDKGDVLDLPASKEVGQISARLGWDVSGEGVDLDVSAVCFAKDGRDVGAVFFGNTEEWGISHSGDNLTGEGAGDDEVIFVDLAKVPEEIDQIFFSVNIYSKGMTFERVSNAYCRICDAEGSELARYMLREGKGESGLMIARLFRERTGHRWGFQALGTFCRGRTWKDSVKDMVPLVLKSALEVQMMRTQSALLGTSSVAPPAGGAAASTTRMGGGSEKPSVTAMPPPQVVRTQKSDEACCNIQ
mmetsp:Transcript_10021/g.22483  ORF Transcript_10021/g.22483 Transcript_10021/m.22483 type:complete len:440 (+) Transcript_10021:65-1384(+)